MVKEDRLFVLEVHAAAVKQQATLEAFSLPKKGGCSGYYIRIKASKQIFRAPWVRGGMSSETMIGTCNSKANADNRIAEINNLIKELDQHVAGKREAKERKRQTGQVTKGCVKAPGGVVRYDRNRLSGHLRGRKGAGGEEEVR